MIHQVRFRNFKALRDVELHLERLTMLTGPNASGKSSVLEGIHLLTRLASADPREVFEGRAGLGIVASRGAQGVLELGLSGTFRRKRGEISIAFTAIEDFPFSDAYRFESRYGDRRFSVRGELHPPGDAATDVHAGGDLGLGLVVADAAHLRFDVDALAAPSWSDRSVPIVESNGAGLGAVVADMAAARPDDFARVQEAMRAVIPGLGRVRLARVQCPRTDGGPAWGHEVVFDMAGASDIPARAASEGMLRALGLFAVLYGAGRPSLVLVDRIEHGIHPSSLEDLMAQVRRAVAHDPDLQLVATTDAPALLDEQEPEAVRVHCLLEDGSVRIKPLVLHPESHLLRTGVRPGAFLAQVGEAWVADEPDDATPPPEEPPPLPRSGSQHPPPLPLEGSASDEQSPVPDEDAPSPAASPVGMPPLPQGARA